MLYVTQTNNGGVFDAWKAEDKDDVIKTISEIIRYDGDEEGDCIIKYDFVEYDSFYEVSDELARIQDAETTTIAVFIKSTDTMYAFFRPINGEAKHIYASFVNEEAYKKAEYNYWVGCYIHGLRGAEIFSDPETAARSVKANVISVETYNFILRHLGIDIDILKEEK